MSPLRPRVYLKGTHISPAVENRDSLKRGSRITRKKTTINTFNLELLYIVMTFIYSNHAMVKIEDSIYRYHMIFLNIPIGWHA